jgi:hypothetical protein
VRFELWTDDHFVQWFPFLKLLQRKPSKVAQQIFHPVLALQGFYGCQVSKITALDQDEETGIFSCEVTFLEFNPPKPALSKPLAAIPNAPKPLPTAEDVADEEILGLAKQWRGLGGGSLGVLESLIR